MFFFPIYQDSPSLCDENKLFLNKSTFSNSPLAGHCLKLKTASFFFPRPMHMQIACTQYIEILQSGQRSVMFEKTSTWTEFYNTSQILV